MKKPFGRDLVGARRLNATLHTVLDEEQIFRSDHYPAKEPVQNLLYFRFANRFLEPMWNANHAGSVQITMAVAFDVAHRGALYDSVGAIRDVVQNHILQTINILAMEPPSGRTAEALRNEKFPPPPGPCSAWPKNSRRAGELARLDHGRDGGTPGSGLAWHSVARACRNRQRANNILV